MTEPFTDNTAKKRFEYHMNGAVAFADYRHEGSMLYIDYVEAPPELRGTGAAGILMQHIMEIARGKKLEVVPICSYAASWISRHAGAGDKAPS